MELLAEGRTAEVFAAGEGRVLKLDRPEWNGLSVFEASVLTLLADAGLPVARPHGTRTVDGRSGVILDRIEGPSLLQVLSAAGHGEVDRLAGEFVALQLQCNETIVVGLPELVPRLRRELEIGVPDARAEGRTSCACWRRWTTAGAGSATSTSIPPTSWSAPTAGSSSTGSPWPRARRPPTWPAPWCCGGCGRAARSGASTRAVRSEGRARRGAGRRRARRLDPHRRRGPRHRGLRRRGEGVAPAGGGRVRAPVRLSRAALLRRRESPSRRDRAGRVTRAPWRGSRARPGRRRRAA